MVDKTVNSTMEGFVMNNFQKNIVPSKNQNEKCMFWDLSKKPKRFGAPKHALHPRPDKPIDYLAEIRKSREKSPRKIVQFNVNEYLSTDKNDNLIEGIQLAKSQTDILDTKVNKKKELMMANGGYSKNPELGNEIGNMLVDSIHAKLDILNAINVKKN